MSKRWLRGDDQNVQIDRWLDTWRLLSKNPGWQENEVVKDIMSPQTIKAWEFYVSLDEEQLKSHFIKNVATKKSRSQPACWRNLELNNPSQPVVGITWFEARAYCAWLTEVSGKLYRLPTEAE